MNRSVLTLVVIAMIAVALLAGLVGSRLSRSEEKTIEEVVVNIDMIKEVAKLATIDYHSSVTEHVKMGHKWYEWKNAELLVEIHGVVEGDALIRPKVRYDLADGFEILAGANFFVGDEGQFGQYDDNDMLYAKITYSF